jgi:copper chaperone
MSHQFTVKDMTCGHCAGRIAKSVQQADPAAQLSIDLPSHKVTVEGSAAAAVYEQAIRAAGYTPQSA